MKFQTGINSERHDLTNEYSKLKNSKQETKEKIDNCAKEQVKIKKLLACFRARGVLIFSILIVIAVLSFIIPYMLFMKFYVGDDRKEWLPVVASVLITIILPTLLSIITTLIYGKPLKFPEVYILLQMKFCKNKAIQLINKEISPQECKDTLKRLDLEVANLQDNYKQIELELGKVEYAIKRIDNLI